jgi:hypothetical protein
VVVVPGGPGGTTTTTTLPTMTTGSADLRPGTYLVPSAEWAVADFTITFPEGWSADDGYLFSKHEDEAGELSLRAAVVDELFDDACGADRQVVPVGPTAADLVAALQAQVGPEVGPPVATTLGGHPATRLDLRVPDGLDLTSCRLFDSGIRGLQLWHSVPAEDYFVLLPNADASVYVVELAGDLQLFVTQHRDDSSNEDVAELRAILDSIRIEG